MRIVIIILIGVLLWVGMLVVLLLVQRKRKRVAIPIDEVVEQEERLSDIEIPQTVIYRETKAVIAALRSDIDRFIEPFDDLTVAKSESVMKALPPADYQEPVSAMRTALIDARGEADKLIAALGRSHRGAVRDPGHPPPRRPVLVRETPVPLATDNTLTMLLSDLRLTVDTVVADIAGFYLALTIRDEHNRVFHARTRAMWVIEHLDTAIAQLEVIASLSGAGK